MTRKSTKRRHRTAASPLMQSALQTAQAAKADAAYQSQLTTARLKVWMTPHGVDATDMLAMLAVVLGTPCECGARQFGPGLPWVQQLHSALRSVAAMCANGYTWDSARAAEIDQAMELASEARAELDVATFVEAWKEANGVAYAIERHEFDAAQIA